jgi:hypothetical protein
MYSANWYESAHPKMPLEHMHARFKHATMRTNKKRYNIWFKTEHRAQGRLGMWPSVLCDVISAVAEFMVSGRVMACSLSLPSALSDVISAVAEFMVRGRVMACSLSLQCCVTSSVR